MIADLLYNSRMDKSGDKSFSWLNVVKHLLIVSVLVGVAIYYIGKGEHSTYSDYISGIGSVASVYAIMIAIWQSRKAKNAAEAAESAANKKSKEIEKFMSFANISRHIEIANSIPPFLAAKQYEAAIIKIDQLKELLVELKENGELSSDDRSSAQMNVIKLGSDIFSLRKQLMGYKSLDEDVLIVHISNVNTFLQEISAKLKKKEI